MPFTDAKVPCHAVPVLIDGEHPGKLCPGVKKRRFAYQVFGLSRKAASDLRSDALYHAQTLFGPLRATNTRLRENPKFPNSVPAGLVRSRESYPGLRPGLHSVVPAV